MKTIVEICWDKLEDENWLCPENIKYALHKTCGKTNFEVKLHLCPQQLSLWNGYDFTPGFPNDEYFGVK